MTTRGDIFGGPHVHFSDGSMSTDSRGPGSQHEVVSAMVNGSRAYLKVEGGDHVRALDSDGAKLYDAPIDYTVKAVGTGPVCDNNSGTCYYVWRSSFGSGAEVVAFDVLTGKVRTSYSFSYFEPLEDPYLFEDGSVAIAGKTDSDIVVVRLLKFNFTNWSQDPVEHQFKYTPADSDPTFYPKDLIMDQTGSLYLAIQASGGGSSGSIARVIRLSYPDLKQTWVVSLEKTVRAAAGLVLRTPVSGEAAEGATIFFGKAALKSDGTILTQSLNGIVLAIDADNTLYLGSNEGVRFLDKGSSLASGGVLFAPAVFGCTSTPRASVNYITDMNKTYQRSFVYISNNACPSNGDYMIQAYAKNTTHPLTKAWEYVFTHESSGNTIYSPIPVGNGLVSARVDKTLKVLSGCNGNGVPLPSGKCQCNKGFEGDFCVKCECSSVTHGTGKCDSQGRCLCQDDFFPVGTCSRYCDKSATCNNHGTCGQSGMCVCENNYFPDNSCKNFCLPSQTCSNNGVCNVMGTCNCDINYYDDDCSKFCNLDTCNNNGYCTSDGECECDSLSGIFQSYNDKCELETNFVSVGGVAAGGLIVLVVFFLLYRRRNNQRRMHQQSLLGAHGGYNQPYHQGYQGSAAAAYYPPQQQYGGYSQLSPAGQPVQPVAAPSGNAHHI